MGEKIGVKKAAELLGVSKRTVYKKLRSGTLPGKKEKFKEGLQKWVIDKEDVEEHARIQNEVVNVKEVDKPIDKEQFLNELTEGIKGDIHEDMEKVEDNIKKTIEQKNEQLQEEIRTLTEKVDRLQEQQNKSLWENIKGIFK